MTKKNHRKHQKRGASDPLIAAHRGASRVARENSPAAIDTAIHMGADMVEIDVRRTRDGVLIVHHDETFGGVRTDAILSTDLKHAGEEAPALLSDILTVAAGRALLDVELKEEGYEDQVLGLLHSHVAPEEFIITSFREGAVAAARREGATVGLLCETPMAPADLFSRARRCGADLVAPHAEMVDDALLEEAARRRVPTLVWTVNEPDQMQRYLDHPAVVGLITDVPDVAVATRGVSRDGRTFEDEAAA